MWISGVKTILNDEIKNELKLRERLMKIDKANLLVIFRSDFKWVEKSDAV